MTTKMESVYQAVRALRVMAHQGRLTQEQQMALVEMALLLIASKADERERTKVLLEDLEET